MNGTATFILGACAKFEVLSLFRSLSSFSNPCVGTKEHQERVTEALCLLRSHDFSIGLHYPLPERGRQSCGVILFFSER